MNAEIAVLRLTCLLLGGWGLLFALQLLADLRSWAPGRALDWELLRLRRSRVLRSRRLARLFAASGVRGLAQVLALVALALMAGPTGPWSLLLLALFIASTALLSLRTGGDGASKMALVVACGAVLQVLGIMGDLPLLVLAGVLWTGGQLTIAYFTAGISKLGLANWRNGDALRAALSSYVWGHRRAARAVACRGVAIAAAWAVILLEVLFPLALFAPAGVLAAALAAMLALHLVIALVMGINTYPWAFLSAYPAIWALGGLARGLV